MSCSQNCWIKWECVKPLAHSWHLINGNCYCIKRRVWNLALPLSDCMILGQQTKSELEFVFNIFLRYNSENIPINSSVCCFVCFLVNSQGFATISLILEHFYHLRKKPCARKQLLAFLLASSPLSAFALCACSVMSESLWPPWTF